MAEDLFKTYNNVFDKATIQAIWGIITQRRIEGLESPIKIGKESNVFSALTKSNERLAVKIYRINTSNFFQMSKYLSMDSRFRPIKRRMQVVLAWSKREFINLKKAYEAGVSVPKPIAVKNNVLVMEFLGEKFPEHPSIFPMLKDDPGSPKEMYEKTIENVRKLYLKAGLVHGDLSEFNILNNGGEPILIDLSHSIPSNNASAEELLRRDIEKLVKFFGRKGVKVNIEDALKYVKGK